MTLFAPTPVVIPEAATRGCPGPIGTAAQWVPALRDADASLGRDDSDKE
ncbi:MAG: hypothetical protein WDM89_03980 [Rhizomicrobium sp.]